MKAAFPQVSSAWYNERVADTQAHAVALGDRGRFVVPSTVRERHGWQAGESLVAIDTDAGMIIMSTDEALAWLRSRLVGRDLVAELLEERRTEVERELR